MWTTNVNETSSGEFENSRHKLEMLKKKTMKKEINKFLKFFIPIKFFLIKNKN